jgi:hypothetical protein
MKIVARVVLSCLIMFIATCASAAEGPVYELRTYTTNPGKLANLHKRFADHTTKLFEKHGMKNIVYWTPTDEKRKENTLVYVIQHKSRAAAKKNWSGFISDPAWKKPRKNDIVNFDGDASIPAFPAVSTTAKYKIVTFGRIGLPRYSFDGLSLSGSLISRIMNDVTLCFPANIRRKE